MKKKVIVFAVRPDEMEAIEKFKKIYLDLELTLIKENLSPENVHLCNGFDGVVFIGNCKVNKEVLERIHSFGIKYISSRSIGFDNVDLKSAKELGIKVSNATYSPYSVAEFALMSGLMLFRNIPKSISNTEKHNFSLAGLIGKEVRNQIVGIIGTGKIGKIVAQYFKMMGARVVCYDLFPSSDELEYLSLDELLANSDLITLHAPLTDETKHIINKDSINKMKEGVLLINSARGELIATEDLVVALKSGKIGGAVLDTLEGEKGIFHRDCQGEKLPNKELLELLSMENVFVTSHQAFYTTQAVSDMVESGLSCQDEFFKTGSCKNELKF